jgi:polyisoprenoid-binding protein YceI
MKLALALALAFLTLPTLAYAKQYEIDESHSNVGFRIRHMVSKVSGKFNKVTGTIDWDAAKAGEGKTVVKIDAASIDTGNAKRDEHLRAPDFFDVKKYPSIEFASTGVKDASDKGGKVEGVIKLHGVEKPVTLDMKFNGEAKDPWGNDRAGFTATTTLNRKDFGMQWNKTLDAGGLLLGDEVEITLEIEATAVKPGSEKTQEKAKEAEAKKVSPKKKK